MRELYTSKVFSKPLCLIAKIKLEKLHPQCFKTGVCQTRRLRENFRGIELSYSTTGLGSTNDLS